MTESHSDKASIRDKQVLWPKWKEGRVICGALRLRLMVACAMIPIF